MDSTGGVRGIHQTLSVKAIATFQSQSEKRLEKQIRFLSQDPSHRSLHIHKLNDEWEFYVDVHHRCFFHQEGDVYTLLTVGTHRLVDRYKKR